MQLRSLARVSFLILPVFSSCPCLAQNLDHSTIELQKKSSYLSSEKLEGEISIKQNKAIFKVDPVTTSTVKTSVGKRSMIRKLSSKARSLANFVFDVRGFDWSKEAANAIQDANINGKDENAKEYLVRKSSDDLDLQTNVLVLQLALYIDTDQQKSKLAFTRLQQLVGMEHATDLYLSIKQLQCEDLDLSDPRLKFDFEQKGLIIKEILTKTAESDKVLKDVSKRLSKHNHRGKLIQTTAKVVYPILGIASFTPTLVAPVAEAALLSFMMATGGPEQDKLLKEIYLAKIMQSRCNLLNEKAHLIVETIDTAVLAKNKRLLTCAREMVKELTDTETATSIVGPFKNTACEVLPLQVAGEENRY